jgi:hypothetical protein
MIVEFTDAVTAAVYINPDFVVSLRPDPADPDRVTIVKLEDGESIPGSRRPPAGRRQAEKDVGRHLGRRDSALGTRRRSLLIFASLLSSPPTTIRSSVSPRRT